MTCASCSARIEKKLGKLDGVDAVVNLATEKATVRFAEPVTVEQLLEHGASHGLRRRGRRGRHPSRRRAAGRPGTDEPPTTCRSTPPLTRSRRTGWHRRTTLKRRAMVAAVLTVPVVVLAMVPGIHLDQQPVAPARARDARRVLVRVALPPGRASTPATSPRRWTPSCRSACWPPTCGRPSSCSPVARPAWRHGCR